MSNYEQLKKSTTVVAKYQKKSKDVKDETPRINTQLSSSGEYSTEKLEALKRKYVHTCTHTPRTHQHTLSHTHPHIYTQSHADSTVFLLLTMHSAIHRAAVVAEPTDAPDAVHDDTAALPSSIPTSEAILLARQRRKAAREQGDFIPLEPEYVSIMHVRTSASIRVMTCDSCMYLWVFL